MSQKKKIAERGRPDTRARLLTQASNEFYRHGYAGASLDRLARAAGLTKAGVFHYFPTKKALLEAVIREVIGSYIERTWVQFFEAGEDPKIAFAQISRYYRTQWAKFYDPKLGCPFYNLLHEVGGSDPALQSLLHGIYERWLTAVEKCFARGLANHRVRAIDARVAAVNLVSIYYGFISQAKLTGSLKVYLQGLDYLETFIENLSRRTGGVEG